MRSSLAWCLEPMYCERESREQIRNGGAHDAGSYIRRTQIRQNFARILEKAPTLKAAGLTGPAIAEELGVSVDSVYRALREAGCGKGK